MTDYRYLVENALENMESKISDFWLFEGITDVAKQFPKLDEKKLRELVALDPTYKGGEQLGKYGMWILQLFYNNIKNSERMRQYQQFYQQNNGINPKTGGEILKPEKLPEVKLEDTYKITPLLKQYELLKNKIKKPITAFKDVPSLYAVIEEFKNQGVPEDKKALERYYIFKNAEKKGLKKIYEDKNWMIGIPETFESSKMFGNVTNWCTTAHNGSYYDRYLNQYGGEYYILLDKRNGNLFQFHFESRQFMNEHDHQIDMYNFSKDEPKVAKFLNEYKVKATGFGYDGDDEKTPVQKEKKTFERVLKSFEEQSKDADSIRKNILYMHHVDDLKIDGDKISGIFDLETLGSLNYDNNARDGLSLETVVGLLTDFYGNFNFYQTSRLNDYDWLSSNWDSVAKKYNIEDYNWDVITEYSFDEDEEVPEEIRNIVMEDFYDDEGLLYFIHRCEESGTEEKCVDDIMYDLKEELPISGRVYENYRQLNQYSDKKYKTVDTEFTITKDDLWFIHFVQSVHNDDYFMDLDSAIKFVNKPEQLDLKLKTITMKKDWFERWSKDNDEDDYLGDEMDEDWIYLWRVSKGKCSLYDGTSGAFSISEPYYGWNDFDNKYFEEGCESAAKRIAQVLGREPKKEVK